MTLKLRIFATLLIGLGLAGCERGPQGVSPREGAHVLTERNLDAMQVARGKALYEQHCLTCHGAGGKGQPGDWRIKDADGYYPPPPLDDTAHAWHHPTTVLLEIIREGSRPGEGKMPGWNGKLSEQDMQDVVAYIKSLWSDEVYALWNKMEQQSLAP